MTDGKQRSIDRFLAPRPVARFFLWALVATCLGLAFGGGFPQALAQLLPPVRITVIGTSDFHGALEPRNEKIVEQRAVGGIDIMAAYVQALRAAHPDTILLLDAGDIYSGTLLSAATEGKSVIEFYNELGYDAAGVGNHDFDFGPCGMHSSPQAPGDDPLCVIKKRISEARFPFLAANILEKESGHPVDWRNLHRTVLLERKGIKIGILGLVTEDVPVTTNKDNVRALAFAPMAQTARELVPQLRRQGAQVVILLVHAGVRVDEDTEEVSGQVVELAQALSDMDIDLIVGGHEHQPFGGRIHGIPVIQAYPKGISFSRADLLVDRNTGMALRDQTVVHENTFFFRDDRNGSAPVYAGRIMRAVPRFTKRLVEFQKSVEHLDRIRLGQAQEKLEHREARDTEVGNLITDGMRILDPEIQIAMYNWGGVRANIPEGTITYGRLYEVLPFDNNVITMALTGAQVQEILEKGLGARYGAMQISGVVVDFDPTRPEGSRISRLATPDGNRIQPSQVYKVATIDFLLKGGDGYTTFASAKDVQNTHTQVREAVARHIQKLGSVGPQLEHRYRENRGP